MQTYDLICIGGGPGGGAAAQRAADKGLAVCLIEQKHLGGTCLNTGCMPTKALLAASEVAWQSRRAGRFGLEGAALRADGPTVMDRLREIVRALRSATEEKYESASNIQRVRGRGRLVGPHHVEVDVEGGPVRLEAQHVVIATGSRPRRPDFLPWDSPRVMTSNELFEMEDLPARLLILGGGPLGCEFATAFAELGASVALVEERAYLLGNVAPAARAAAAEALSERGVELHLGRELVSLIDERGRLRAELDNGREIPADRALIAVGRAPNLEDFGLDTIGLEPGDDGVLRVDDQCRTSVEHIFAVGDVADPRKHSHLAERMGTVAGDVIGGGDLRDDRRFVPIVVYTHPQIACVGVCGEPPHEDEDSCEPVRYEFGGGGTARLYEEDRGFLELLLRLDGRHLAGATWVGPHAMDLIVEVALALRHDLTLQDVWNTLHPHPSFQESLHAAVESYLSP